MANAFESGERKVIPAVLVYGRCGDDVLMIYKGPAGDGGTRDGHAGKWNGLGGKLEADESPLEAAARELGEESGLRLAASEFRSLGMILFPNFKPHKREDWMVYLFSAEVPLGLRDAIHPECAEGRLEWVPAAKVPALSLWDGDTLFIPYVLRREPVLGTLWYRDQKVVRHELRPF